MSAPLEAPPRTTRVRPRRAYGSRVWMAVAFAVVAGFHFFTVATSGDLRRDAPFDYYARLVEGFRAGHLYLSTAPDPRLLALADPYDPQQNAEYRLGDASLYRRHYYLYFGVTPAVTLLLPYAVMTGHTLPQAAAVLVFCVIGLAAGSWLIALMCSRAGVVLPAWFPATAVLVLGFGTHVAALTRRPEIWELPIAAAFAFVILTIVAVVRSIESPRPIRWVAAAGLCLGFAIGARPTAVLAGGILVVGLVAIWRQHGRRTAVTAAVTAASVLAPMLLALGWYNYARFGSWFEFGQAYQLSNLREGAASHFAGRYLLHNVRVYFAWPVELGWHFPFLSARPLPPAPVGYYAGEELYCIALLAPFVSFGAVLMWRPSTIPANLAPIVAVLTAAVLPVFLLLLSFFSATERYMVEWLPELMLLAIAGAVAAYARFDAGQRWLTIGIALTAAVTIVTGLLASFDYHGQLMRRTAPVTWQAIAEKADVPSAVVRRMLHGAPERAVGGVLHFDVTLAALPHGEAQPLLVLGRAPRVDAIGIKRLSDAEWTVLHDHWGAPLHAGPVIRLDPSARHAISISIPSCTGATFGTPVAGDVTVTIDGHEALRAWSDTFGITDDDVAVGCNTVGVTTLTADFRGSITSVRWKKEVR